MNIHEKAPLFSKDKTRVSRLSLLEWLMRKGGRLVGVAFSITGWLFLLVGLFLGYCFFYVDDHVLCVFPKLAEKVSFEDLTANPKKYDGRWVRVEGELWRCRRFEAVLVPPGSGPEQMHRGAVDERYQEAVQQEGNYYLAINQPEREIPLSYLRLYNFSPGVSRTVSFYQDGVVEVAGEFESSGLSMEEPPYLDVAVMVRPRQHLYWVPISIYLGICLLGVAAFFPFHIMGRDIRRGLKVQ